MKPRITWALGLMLTLQGGASLAQDSAAQRGMRAAWYAFGTGYTAALIAQAPPQPDEGQRRARSAAGSVAWIAVKGFKPAPLSLTVSRPGTVGYDITVGSTTAAEIRRLFGTPTAEKAGQLTYEGEAEICSDHYDFVFRSGVLQGVSWTWCTD